MKRRIWGFIAAVPLGLWAQAGRAYQVSCDGLPQIVTSISSVMGEPRPISGAITRFHAGIDITNIDCKTIDKSVEAIQGGKIATTTPGCEPGAACFRITAPNGHAFDYVHVNLLGSLTNGSIVEAGDQVGTIQDPPLLPPHLHLNEIYRHGLLNLRVNPQRPGALDFQEPTDRPTFDPLTVGSVNDALILVPEYTGPGNDGDQTYSPFTYRNNIFFVRGSVEALISANDGTVQRKGLWGVGLFPQTAGYLYPGQINISMDTLADMDTMISDVRTIYLQRNTLSNTFFGMNKKLNSTAGQQAVDGAWQTDTETPGTVTVCAKITDYPQGNTAQRCRNVIIDRMPPAITLKASGSPFTVATNIPIVTVEAIDTGSGIYSIKLDGVSYSSTNYVTGVQTTASNQFPDASSLVDGEYTATVVDLAGNSASAAFTVKTTPPDGEFQDALGNILLGNVFSSTTSLVVVARSDALIAEAEAGLLSCQYNSSDVAKCGPVPSLAPGIHTSTITDFAGNIRTTTFTVVSGITQGYLTYVGSGSTINANFNADPGAILFGYSRAYIDSPCLPTGFPIDKACAQISGPGPCVQENVPCRFIRRESIGAPDRSFTISNSSDELNLDVVTIQYGIFRPDGTPGGGANIVNAPYNGTGSFSATMSQLGQKHIQSLAGTLNTIFQTALRIVSTLAEVTMSVVQQVAQVRQVLRQLSAVMSVSGSEIIYLSTGTVNFTMTGVSLDTSTIRIYAFNGFSWSSATVTNQEISLTTSGVLSATGTITQSGTFALFYPGSDSSAPITSLTMQGSSLTFDGAIFVSTDAYVLLTSTDPTVNGFASQVATTYYRLDPSTAAQDFTVYTASFPVPLGTHVLQYYSDDWAGNDEVVKTTTFTATAGAAFRATGSAHVPGTLLNGFLGSGAKAEVESRAENSYTLAVSSVNRQTLVSVDNIGQMGIGVVPQANLDIGQGSIALQLRSGNSTSSVSAAQIAFGYNGDYSMRHFFRTEHSTATEGNKMDFLVWNPGAGSTTTLANLNALSLQGIAAASNGSFHVHPYGEPDAEVEVSDGLSTGGGTMQRLQVLTPSSRRFKTDIAELSEKDERRALDDLIGLKHVRFRYRSLRKDDPAQPLRTGLIYEEAPKSIRTDDGALSSTERMANVEMALKASIRRFEELRKKYDELKAGDSR